MLMHVQLPLEPFNTAVQWVPEATRLCSTVAAWPVGYISFAWRLKQLFKQHKRCSSYASGWLTSRPSPVGGRCEGRPRELWPKVPELQLSWRRIYSGSVP